MTGRPSGDDALSGELTALQALVWRLRAENARLMRLLELSPKEAELPAGAQGGWFEVAPGPVHGRSEPSAKVAFFVSAISRAALRAELVDPFRQQVP